VHNAWARSSGNTEWKGKGFAAAMSQRGFKRSKSSVVYWLDIRLIKSVNDFIDHEGRPLRHDGSAPSQAAYPPDRRSGGDDEFEM